VDDLLAAPVGVALLDRLELAARGSFRPFDALQYSDRLAVAAACEQVRTMPVGSLLTAALDAASDLAGPWSPVAVDSLTWAYHLAGARRSLAEVVWSRFAALLGGPLERDAQEHWIDEPDPSPAARTGVRGLRARLRQR
jgi:hypothetical protein